MIPVRCPHCLVSGIAVGDRFCPHCGGPAAVLHVSDGGQMTLVGNATGKAYPCVEMENRGVEPVRVLFVPPPDEMGIRLRGQEVLELPPFSGPVLVSFEVDAAALRGRPGLRAELSFSSDAPNLPHGTLSAVISTPARVEIPKSVSLGVVLADGGAAFEIPFSNRGNNRCRISLLPQGTSSSLVVSLPSKGPFDLRGGETRLVRFEVRVPEGISGNVSESPQFVVADLDAGPGRAGEERLSVALTAAVTRPSAPPEITPMVDFGVVPRRQVVFQEVLASHPGDSGAVIDEGRLRSPYLRWMESYFPRRVDGEKTSFVAALSSRWAEGVPAPPVPPEGHLKGFLAFRSGGGGGGGDGGKPAWTFADWRAQIQVPGKQKGVFAIDFGTANSCVARFDGNGEPVAITDPALPAGKGSAIIPSMMVFLDPELFALGKRAEENVSSVRHPERVVDSVKRALLGRPRSIMADEDADYSPADPVYGRLLRKACAACPDGADQRARCAGENRRLAWKAAHACPVPEVGPVRGREYLPMELASMMMEQLLLEAERCALNPPLDVAMTVPANFTGAQRQAMITACRLARGGATGSVRVIDEPSAAAMDYVYRKKRRESGAFSGGRHHILVFDFGGGTLDVCVVAVDALPGGLIEVRPLAARGDNRMGGIDIDIELLRHMADQAKNAPGCGTFAAHLMKMHKNEFDSIALANRAPFAANRRQWYMEARRCKEELCSSPDPSPKVTFTSPPLLNTDGEMVREGVSLELDRPAFDAIVRDRVEKAKALAGSTLRAAGIRTEQVDTLLLTGQSSRIPAFNEGVRGLFPGAHVPADVDKKTCVATGAAIAVHMMVNAGHSFKVHNLDRTSYSYGLIRQGAFLQWGYTEMLGVGTPFSEASKGVRLSLDQLNERMWAGQNDDGSPGPFDAEDPAITTLVAFSRKDVAKTLGLGRMVEQKNGLREFVLDPEEEKAPFELILSLEGDSHELVLDARLASNGSGGRVPCAPIDPEGVVYL